MSDWQTTKWTLRKRLVFGSLIALLVVIAVAVRAGQWACRLVARKQG